MNIWAQALVKNEGRFLWYSVSSVITNVDKILLWDSGSSDSTIRIISELQKKYPEKIDFRQRKVDSVTSFTEVRQEMLDATKSDWILMLDGDEIWWEESINKAVNSIKNNKNAEAIVVPTLNLVGDMYHYQSATAGRYKFGDRVGHYNLRAVKRSIPGLHSEGMHGVWGWADEDGKQVQDRNTFKFVDAPYLHATHLIRSDNSADSDVIKRSKKLKHEIGIEFPKDYYYPESFFIPRPDFIKSPWQNMQAGFKFVSLIETPLRMIKRRLIKGKTGY